MVFLPLLASIATRSGWRTALGLVCALLAAAALLVWLFMRDRPADLGLRPFGPVDAAAQPAAAATQPGAAAAPAAADAARPSIAVAALLSLRDAARTRAFWILFGTFFICGASTNGLIQTHFIPFCSDRGLPEVGAAGVLATWECSTSSAPLPRAGSPTATAPAGSCSGTTDCAGLSLIYLPFADFTYTGLSVFALFYGLDWIATVPPTVNITVRVFGRDKANLVFGWVFAGHQLGAATAALGAGISRTELATYLPAFMAAGALCIVAAGMTLWLAPRRVQRRLIPQTFPAQGGPNRR